MGAVRAAGRSSARAFGRLLVAAGALGVSLGSGAGAQSGPTAPSVGRALARIKADNAWILGQQQSICEIPAPPFKESVRARNTNAGSRRSASPFALIRSATSSPSAGARGAGRR